MGQKSKQPDMLNMTVHIDRKLWQEFTIKVIKDLGGRANSLVMINLIKQYIDGKVNFVPKYGSES